MVERVRHPLRVRLLEVRSVEDLVPGMRRITLTGDGLADFRSAAPDDHVKLIFPGPGEDRPRLPAEGDDRVLWPEGPKPAMRDYTPRRFDADARELVIDVVVHGDGLASTWAAGAAPGALIGQAGPRGSQIVTGEVAWWLLACDETGLPAVARRLEELPAGVPVVVLAEVEGRGAELSLVTDADAEVRWLHRSAGERLEDAVRAWSPPSPAEGFCWVAGEVATARALRRHLREERGFAKDRTKVTGYWRRGEADFHEPVEER